MKLLPINIYDLRMYDFSTETAVCLQTLHYSVLIGAANAFYARIIHMITCSEVFAKSPAFLLFLTSGGTSVVVPYCYLFLLSVFIIWFNYYVSDIF